MTGYDLYKRVCGLLGYSLESETLNDKRTGRMTDIIGLLSDDLKIQPVASLSAELNADEKTEALVYGCAMMLAVTEGDDRNAAFFTELYNAKRAAALCCADTRRDVNPAPSDGGQ